MFLAKREEEDEVEEDDDEEVAKFSEESGMSLRVKKEGLELNGMRYQDYWNPSTSSSSSSSSQQIQNTKQISIYII